MDTRTDVVVIQIGMKDVRMEVVTLPRHRQDLQTRDGCRKVLKKPRKGAIEHKKREKASFPELEMHDRGLG